VLSQDKLVVFEDKKVSDLKKQLSENEGFVQLLGKIEQLKLVAADGKKYLTDIANTETIIRLLNLWQIEFFEIQGAYFYLPRAAILALEGESPIIVLPWPEWDEGTIEI